MKHNKGFLVAFEGIDGTGKTSLAFAIKKRLEELGFEVVVLKEPTTETAAGKKIRESYYKGRASPEEELQWFMEDREWDVQERILPALSQNKIVLMDRYYFSSACYQGARLDNDWESILVANRAKFPEPNLTIILDIEPEIALQRVAEKRKKSSFESIESLQAVRELFIEIAQKDRIGSILLLDSSLSLKELEDQIFSAILAKYWEKFGND